MTGQDIDRLFELLGIFRPGDKHLEDQNLKNAWLLVLKPYKTEDVRNAVAEYFRQNKYWPDVTDISRLCPPIKTESRNELSKKTDHNWEKQLETLRRYKDLKRRRREAGLPETGWEAKEAGMSVEEYDQFTAAAGLELEQIFTANTANGGMRL